jgi:hypothetical protein
MSPTSRRCDASQTASHHHRRRRVSSRQPRAHPLLGAEFIPRLDEGAIAMQIWRVPSISLEQSNALSTMAEQVIIEGVRPRGRHGRLPHRPGRDRHRSDGRGDQRRVHHAQSARGLALRQQRALVAEIDEGLKKDVPGAIFSLLAAHRAAGGRADLGGALGRGGPRLRRRSRAAEGHRATRSPGCSRPSPGRPRPRPNRRPACRSCACGSTAGRSRATGSTPRRAPGGRGHRRQAWWARSWRASSASTCRCDSVPKRAPIPSGSAI